MDVNEFPLERPKLLELGRIRVQTFCQENSLPSPMVTAIPSNEWYVGACAYYRPDEGIKICLTECQVPCGIVESRNWSWPGSTVDREPYGVVCHELGHHADWHKSERKGAYGGDYSYQLMDRSGEKTLTSYSPNPWEWFAEMFRLFVTNPDLLRLVRPRTYSLLLEQWKPATTQGWREALGTNVPPRVIRANANKMVVDEDE